MTTKHAIIAEGPKKRYLPGETIVLGCKLGYAGIGNNNLQCTDEGKWARTDFYCESKFVHSPHITFMILNWRK